jgi:glycosyltransferase involved in cell wall biosynthesis
MKVALVHDWLNQFGGAEVVLEVMHEMYPDAPVYTSLYDSTAMPPAYRNWDIRTSFIQRLPGARRAFRTLLPLYPLAFEQFDLRDYDLVLSSSSSWAKGVITTPETVHVCYCHAPMRYCWDVYYDEAPRRNVLMRAPLAVAISYLRLWDVDGANRVDSFVANSGFVAAKIRKYYRREATVVHPPVETGFFQPCNEDGDFFLAVSRLRPYKRIDVTVEAFSRLGLKLKVVGVGEEMKRLRAMAAGNIEFLGFVPRDTLRDLMAHCRALIVPGREDFGLTPVETMAAGRPVIAYGAGGLLETVIDGETGVLFAEQTAASLEDAVRRFMDMTFDKERLRQHALAFDVATFKRGLSDAIAVACAGQGQSETLRGDG